MKKIFLIFSINFLFFIPLNNTFAETLSVSGLYIGEKHNTAISAKKYIDKYKETGLVTTTKNIIGSKKLISFSVMQNNYGLHIRIFYKNALFAAMKLNSDGTFKGTFNKNTLDGYFENDILYAKLYWKGQDDPVHLVGILSEHDKNQRKQISDLIGEGVDGKSLQKRIDELELELESTQNQCLADLISLEEEKDKEIKICKDKLSVQPKININNLDLADSIKKEATLWSGPAKEGTFKIGTLPADARISVLRSVKRDNNWTLIATDRGRLGYVETLYIRYNQTPVVDEGTVTELPSDSLIEITVPANVKENGIVEVDSAGPQTIRGIFDKDKIKNVKSITINQKESKFMSNKFIATISILSGVNKINIKILNTDGEQFEFNFSIKAPG